MRLVPITNDTGLDSKLTMTEVVELCYFSYVTVDHEARKVYYQHRNQFLAETPVSTPSESVS